MKTSNTSHRLNTRKLLAVAALAALSVSGTLAHADGVWTEAPAGTSAMTLGAMHGDAPRTAWAPSAVQETPMLQRARPLHGDAARPAARASANAAPTSTLTRQQVRADLKQARALNLLPLAGDAGATRAVLQARERHNATQALVLGAKADLQQRQQARAEAAANEQPLAPEQVAYVEQGRNGPVAVLLSVHADGDMSYANVPLQRVEMDVD